MTTTSASKPTALITGASSGIGYELSRLFAADGYTLVLSARRVDHLNQLADELRRQYGITVHVMPKDLAQPGAARTLWDEVCRMGIFADVLVNNAGMGISGAFAGSDPDGTETMLRLNMEALTVLSHCALPEMVRRGRGRILNLGSVAGYQPGGPGMAVYYATKAYVLSFSRALAVELRGRGVTVTVLCPGPTHTEFEEKAGVKERRLFRWMRPMDARSVALAGYRGMLQGRMTVIPGWLNKFAAFSGELPPRRIALEINRLLLGG